MWWWSAERRSAALVPMLCLLGLHAHAQSFDCDKARTAVEHAICSDKVLRDEDSSLASTLRDSMSAVSGEQLRDYISEERRWLAYRDKQCAPVSLSADETLPECLAAVYRARIAYLKSLRVPDTTNCQRIADRYRPLAAAHPGERPLSVVTASAQSGVSLATAVAEITDPASDLQKWASKQTPPFIVPPEATQFLSRGPLEKLPNGNFYALGSKYFTVEHGRLHRELGPPGFANWRDPSSEVRRVFGRIDDQSVFFEEIYADSPQLSSDITVATWSDGGFYSSCTVTFAFAPKFSDQPRDPWQDVESRNACSVNECTDLRRAALELVEAVQRNPVAARNQQEAKLSARQRPEYEAALNLATRDQTRGPINHSDADPAKLTRQHPIRLPYIYEGRVYLASVGHFRVQGWYFPDWDVAFEALEDGKLAPEGEFAVGMTKGDLMGTSFSRD